METNVEITGVDVNMEHATIKENYFLQIQWNEKENKDPYGIRDLLEGDDVHLRVIKKTEENGKYSVSINLVK